MYRSPEKDVDPQNMGILKIDTQGGFVEILKKSEWGLKLVERAVSTQNRCKQLNDESDYSRIKTNVVMRRFARTPGMLCKFIGMTVKIACRDFVGKGHGRCIELCAGDGAITQYLPANTLAVERDAGRAVQGEVIANIAKWVVGDIFNGHTIAFLLSEGPFDVVVCNPPFERANGALRVAKELTGGVIGARIFFLLPGNAKGDELEWTPIWDDMGIEMKGEFDVGRWDYYGHGS